MSAWKLAVALLAAWLLIRFWLHPLLVRHWVGGNAGVKMSRAGTLAALEMARNQLFRLGIVLAFILLALVIAGVLTDSDSVLPQAVIAAIAAIASGFDGVTGTFATVVTIVTLSGGAIVLYRTSKLAHARVRQALADRIEAAQSTLFADPSPHAELSRQPEFADLYDQVYQLEQLRPQLTTPDDLKKLDEAKARIINQITLRYALRGFDPVAVLRVSKEQPAVPKGGVLTRILASEGLAKDLGLVRINLDRVGTALLVVSLLTWSSQPLADSFRLAATNLEVSFQKKEAARQYEEAISRKADAEDPDDEILDDASVSDVGTVTRIVTRSLVDSIVRERFLAATNVRRGVSSAYTRESVRGAILGANVEPIEGSKVVDKLHAEALQQDAHPPLLQAQRESIAAELEPQVRRHIEELQQRNPGRWHAFANHVQSRYATPLSVWSAQEKVVATAIGHALDAADTDLDSEIGKQGRKIAKEFGRKALANWIDVQMQDFIGRTALQSAVNSMPGGQASQFINTGMRPESRSMLNDLAVPGSHAAPKLHVTYRNLAVQDAADRAGMAANIRASAPDVDPELLARLHGYDALYPARAPQVHAESMEGIGGVGGGGGGGSSPSSAKGRSSGSGPSVSRSASTNFMRAARSGFARGVLFGRTTETAAASLADIRWQKAIGGHYSLDVQRVNGGRWASLGTFSAAEINQALRFAADERVVAVTMVSGEPLAQLAIHLHPALVDTALGCRVIEMDRFVDTLDRHIPSVHRSRAAIQALSVLMKVAASKPAEICESTTPPSELLEAVANGRDLPAGFVTNLRSALEPHAGSLAMADHAIDCARLPRPSDALQCVCRTDQPIAYPVYVPIDITSQVREKNFTADAGFSWMRRTSDALGHVDFWLHMILSKVESNGSSAPLLTEDSTIAVDFGSDDLAMLNREVRPLVRSFVTSPNGLNSDYEEFMRPVEQFILLQRFFRIALSSGFGEQFPLTKLVALERETKTSVRQQITLRWQVTEAEQEKALSEIAPGQYELWKKYERQRQLMSQACDT